MTHAVQMDFSAASQRTFNELKHRLDKLKARQHPKNALKKLPGYGSTWFYRKRSASLSPSEGEEEAPLAVDASQVTAFVKKLRTRPPPEDTEEDMSQVVQGPGFEFPSDKEAAKCVKHWSKRFKHWQPAEAPVTAPPRPVIRFKQPLLSNEVEVDGKRYRRVESRDEMASLWRNSVAMVEKLPTTICDARFYGELLKEDSNDVQCRFVTPFAEAPPEGAEIKDLVCDYAISEIFVAEPLASRVVEGMQPHLETLDGQETASSVRDGGESEDALKDAMMAPEAA